MSWLREDDTQNLKLETNW